MQILGRRVLVRLKAPKAPAGGIIIPETVKELYPFGFVRAIGPEVTDYMVGNCILFDPRKGAVIEEDGIEYRLVNEEDIDALISEEI